MDASPLAERIVCASDRETRCGMRRDAWQAARWTVAVLLLSAAATAAQAAGRNENWNRVKALAPGKLIVVESRGQQPDECRVVSADDASLTCLRDPDPDVDWRPGDNARVVFPRKSVQSVRLVEKAVHHHWDRWIAAAVGAASLGSLSARTNSYTAWDTRNAAIGTSTVLGGLLGYGVAAFVDSLGDIGKPPGSRVHRRLVYDAPMRP